MELEIAITKARDVADRCIARHAGEHDRNGSFPREAIKKIHGCPMASHAAFRATGRADRSSRCPRPADGHSPASPRSFALASSCRVFDSYRAPKRHEERVDSGFFEPADFIECDALMRHGGVRHANRHGHFTTIGPPGPATPQPLAGHGW